MMGASITFLKVSAQITREALLKDGVLTWVLELGSSVGVARYGALFALHVDLRPLLTLCKHIRVLPISFVTGKQLPIFVRQVRLSWGACAKYLHDYDEQDVRPGVLARELGILSGHVYMVRDMLSESATNESGEWTTEVIETLRAAAKPDEVESPAYEDFFAFYDSKGVPVFADVLAQKRRLERVSAKVEGHTLDFVRLVEALTSVRELAAPCSTSTDVPIK